jgi:hypothetical protein
MYKLLQGVYKDRSKLSDIVQCKVLPRIHNKGAGNDRLRKKRNKKERSLPGGNEKQHKTKEDRARRNPNQSAQWKR